MKKSFYFNDIDVFFLLIISILYQNMKIDKKNWIENKENKYYKTIIDDITSIK